MEQILVPTLKRGDIVIMDNLSVIKLLARGTRLKQQVRMCLPAALFARLEPNLKWPSAN
jgi:hypothetical protein